MEIETIMELVCDCCHYPYITEDQTELDDRCKQCEIEKSICALVQTEHNDVVEKFSHAIAGAMKDTLDKGVPT